MRKTLLALTLAALAGTASAQTLATATMRNGELRLTLADCPMTQLSNAKDRMLAYVRLGDGKTLAGCWDEFDGQVRVTYVDNDTRLYPYTGFKLTKLGQEVIDAGKRAEPERKLKMEKML